MKYFQLLISLNTMDHATKKLFENTSNNYDNDNPDIILVNA